MSAKKGTAGLGALLRVAKFAARQRNSRKSQKKSGPPSGAQKSKASMKKRKKVTRTNHVRGSEARVCDDNNVSLSVCVYFSVTVVVVICTKGCRPNS